MSTGADMTEQKPAFHADALSRITREWHDLSPELWDSLSIERKFELVEEMAHAIENEGEHDFASAFDPTNIQENMRGMAGALQACVDQIQQMKGLFDDSDGTIEDALQAAEEALESYHASHTQKIEGHKPIPRSPRMKG